ncbi:MAG: NADH-quinone oxidoreductase subunit C [Humidesulfovibrio sp.]|nr:NADH-quinone oxidoreductase subunit C [Humidesulfovibrio sp.]
MDALFQGLSLDYLAACDYAKTGKTWQVFLPASSLVKAAERLRVADWHLEDVLALDCAEGFVVTYHFAHFDKPGRVAIRVLAPHDAPNVPSISHVFDGALWHERETRDFHGVIFEGHPNLIPLLLDPDMADCFPLRKEPKSRAKTREMLEVGEVVYCRPSFTLMTPDAPAEGQESGGPAATA